jgi:hypothetical protein
MKQRRSRRAQRWRSSARTAKRPHRLLPEVPPDPRLALSAEAEPRWRTTEPLR